MRINCLGTSVSFLIWLCSIIGKNCSWGFDNAIWNFGISHYIIQWNDNLWLKIEPGPAPCSIDFCCRSIFWSVTLIFIAKLKINPTWLCINDHSELRSPFLGGTCLSIVFYKPEPEAGNIWIVQVHLLYAS